MRQNLLFLYLDTGAGHITPARILKDSLEKAYPREVSVTLLNGFSPRQIFARFFFEKGYHASSNMLPAAYSFFYDLTKFKPALECTKALCTWRTVPFLERYIREHCVTKVVCFHFVVAPAAVRAIRRVNPGIRFIIVVTDPFSAHPSWFLERDQQFIVYSSRLKDEMIHRYGIDGSRIAVMPFLLSPGFQPVRDPLCLAQLKDRYGFAAGRKTVLVVGGGEGLPGAVPLVSYFVRRDPPFDLVVVCGRNVRMYRQLERLKKKYPHARVKLFGFVPFMSDLIKCSDCVVTKAGASTVMEVLACEKPVIFSTFIHGQELENVRFAVVRRVGWFLPRFEDMYEKVLRLFTDASYAASVRDSLRQLYVPSDNTAVRDFVYRF